MKTVEEPTEGMQNYMAWAKENWAEITKYDRPKTVIDKLEDIGMEVLAPFSRSVRAVNAEQPTQGMLAYQAWVQENWTEITKYDHLRPRPVVSTSGSDFCQRWGIPTTRKDALVSLAVTIGFILWLTFGYLSSPTEAVVVPVHQASGEVKWEIHHHHVMRSDPNVSLDQDPE
jgi:hypothetical protein